MIHFNGYGKYHLLLLHCLTFCNQLSVLFIAVFPKRWVGTQNWVAGRSSLMATPAFLPQILTFLPSTSLCDNNEDGKICQPISNFMAVPGRRGKQLESWWNLFSAWKHKRRQERGVYMCGLRLDAVPSAPCSTSLLSLPIVGVDHAKLLTATPFITMCQLHTSPLPSPPLFSNSILAQLAEGEILVLKGSLINSSFGREDFLL